MKAQCAWTDFKSGCFADLGRCHVISPQFPNMRLKLQRRQSRTKHRFFKLRRLFKKYKCIWTSRG